MTDLPKLKPRLVTSLLGFSLCAYTALNILTCLRLQECMYVCINTGQNYYLIYFVPGWFCKPKTGSTSNNMFTVSFRIADAFYISYCLRLGFLLRLVSLSYRSSFGSLIVSPRHYQKSRKSRPRLQDSSNVFSYPRSSIPDDYHR